MQYLPSWLNQLNWTDLLRSATLIAFTRALILVIIGIILARLARLAIMRSFKHLTPQQRLLFRRGVSYTILGLFAISALRELNFNFSVFLGAAGIVTLAVGFASQTSVSNIISGLFLVLERSVQVGDAIKVDATTGEVLSVDLLSTKIRTFDNLLVRIPNETMIKTNITSLNRFPIRRVDTQLGVAYEEDLGKVTEVLFNVADHNPLSLDEPKPLIVMQGFGDSSINLQFSVWGSTSNYLALRNSIQKDIKTAFDNAGIDIPFPHRTLYTGSALEPFPIKIIHNETPQETLEP